MHLGPIVRALLHNPTRFWLITLEVALTLAIVVNCVAIIVEQRELVGRPSGLDEENLAVVTVRPFAADFEEKAYLDAVREEDLRRLRALSGVRAAATIDWVPLGGGGSITVLRPPDVEGDGQPCPFFVVGSDALEALGVELVAGRGFVESDMRPGLDDPESLIVTRALADRLYPDGDALGKPLHDVDADALFGTIVGIIDRMDNAWPGSSIGEFTMLRPGPDQDSRRVRYLVRTDPGSLDQIYDSLETTVLDVNADRIISLRSMTEYKARYFRSERVLVKVLSGLAVLLVAVTSLGIIGLTSFSVTQRKREIGTRRALGATRSEVLKYFVTEIWVIVGIGLVAGVFLAYALNYVLAQLAGAPALPWALLAGGVALLWAVGVAAAVAPAFQATLVPPVVTTRTV
jgi:putative ABC transport system permease protein